MKRTINKIDLAAPFQLGMVPGSHSEQCAKVAAHSVSMVKVAGAFITNRCPMSCSHCFNNSGPKMTAELTTPQMKLYLDWAKQSFPNLETVALSGGEPLVHSGLGQILEYIKEYDYKANITTGGYTLKENPDETLKELKEMGLDSIVLSLDRYHLKFVAMEEVEKIVNSAMNYDLSLVINLSNSNDAEYDNILKMIDSKIDPSVSIHAFPIFSVGRGEKIQNSMRAQKCGGTAATTVMINFDGSIYKGCDLDLRASEKICHMDDLKEILGHHSNQFYN